MEMSSPTDVDLEISYKKPSLGFYAFEHNVSNIQVKFHVLKMKDSVFIWIGDSERLFSDLSLAVISRFSNYPTTTKIMGDKSNMTSSALSARLSKKLLKPIYVSYNLSEEREVTMTVAQLLAAAISKNPENF